MAGRMRSQASLPQSGKMTKLLLSTNSPDKIREFRQILEGLPVEIVSPADLGLKLEVAETGIELRRKR